MTRIVLALIAGALLSAPFAANAEPAKKPDAAARKEAMLKKFDKDGDGKLSDEEKAAMKAEMKKRRAEGGAKGGNAERRAEMMKKFDKDGDGKLNDEEKAAMRAEMQKRREAGGGKPKDGGKKPAKKKAD